MNVRRIPIIVRIPLALLCDAIVAFGPIGVGLYFRGPIHPFVIIAVGILWIIFFDHQLLWRIDVFWNVKSLQNKTQFPLNPDNHRMFKTFKGWIYWIFLGKDIENK